ncbi:MAG: hypothetical protein IJP86_01715 [Synergistaceae bacterium]|nr:hypothetical protein [Synergistaceae bacterium]
MNHPDILWLMPQGNMTVINVDFVREPVDFVSLYTEFADGTSSDIHVKETDGSRHRNNSAPMYDI